MLKHIAKVVLSGIFAAVVAQVTLHISGDERADVLILAWVILVFIWVIIKGD